MVNEKTFRCSLTLTVEQKDLRRIQRHSTRKQNSLCLSTTQVPPCPGPELTVDFPCLTELVCPFENIIGGLLNRV